MGMTLMYALTMGVIAFAMVMCRVLDIQTVTDVEIQVLSTDIYMCLYLLSL